MLKTLNILKVVITLMVISSFGVIGQEQSTDHNQKSFVNNSNTQFLESDKCQDKITTKNENYKLEDINILQARIENLELQLNPLMKKIDVLKSLIRNFEREKAAYLNTNWELEHPDSW